MSYTYLRTSMKTIEISDSNSLPRSPLVSVIMLAYRHERFVAQAIEGVVNQQCSLSFELIIGEDCSPDDTGEIVKRYQRRYPGIIRILTAQENVGMHDNSARCLAAARGEFIAFCEGDDYWHEPRKLQMQVEVMTTSPSMTLCHTDYDRIIGFRLKKNRHSAAPSPYLAEGNAYKNLLQRWSVITATSMYRADVVRSFEKSQFNNRNWPFSDYNLALYASTRGGVAYLPISTAAWRKVTGSATNDTPSRMLKMRIASLACREAFMDKYPVDHETRKSCLSFANRIVMNAAFHACDRENFHKARDRLIELNAKPKFLPDLLRRCAMKLKFPAKSYNAVRLALLRLVTDGL